MADAFMPAFGKPVTAWWRLFAWRPIWTVDRGWVWLRIVSRRRIVKNAGLPGGKDLWFQYAVFPASHDSGEADRG